MLDRLFFSSQTGTIVGDAVRVQHRRIAVGSVAVLMYALGSRGFSRPDGSYAHIVLHTDDQRRHIVPTWPHDVPVSAAAAALEQAVVDHQRSRGWPLVGQEDLRRALVEARRWAAHHESALRENGLVERADGLAAGMPAEALDEPADERIARIRGLVDHPLPLVPDAPPGRARRLIGTQERCLDACRRA